jgi:hypothetical protein
MSGPSEPDPSENPYEPPRSRLTDPTLDSDKSFLFGEEPPEKVRHRYLEREATIKAIGLIFAAMGFLFFVNFAIALFSSGLWTIFEVEAERYELPAWLVRLGMIVLALAVSAGLIAVGLELRRLRNWARWVIMFLLASLLLFWVRTFLTTSLLDRALAGDWKALVAVVAFAFRVILILSLLKSDSQLVCSSSYRSVIAKTLWIRPVFGVRDRVLFAMYAIEMYPFLKLFFKR